MVYKVHLCDHYLGKEIEHCRNPRKSLHYPSQLCWFLCYPHPSIPLKFTSLLWSVVNAVSLLFCLFTSPLLNAVGFAWQKPTVAQLSGELPLAKWESLPGMPCLLSPCSLSIDCSTKGQLLNSRWDELCDAPMFHLGIETKLFSKWDLTLAGFIASLLIPLLHEMNQLRKNPSQALILRSHKIVNIVDRDLGNYLTSLSIHILSQFRLVLPIEYTLNFIYLRSYSVFVLSVFIFFSSFFFMCIPNFLNITCISKICLHCCRWLQLIHFYFCVIKSNKLLFILYLDILLVLIVSICFVIENYTFMKIIIFLSWCT